MSHGVVGFPSNQVSGWLFTIWITVISKVDKILNPSSTNFHVLIQQWSKPEPVDKLIRMSNSSRNILFSVEESVQGPSTLVIEAVEIRVGVELGLIFQCLIFPGFESHHCHHVHHSREFVRKSTSQGGFTQVGFSHGMVQFSRLVNDS